MGNPDNFFYLLKRFFSYYRLPISVINSQGVTRYCFPQESAGYILPSHIMKENIKHYQDSHIDFYTPYLINAPFDSFIAIIPLPDNNFVFIGPSFYRSFNESRISDISNEGMSKQDLLRIQQVTKKLPLVDESYMADALSLLVLLLHYKEISPQNILSANKLTYDQRTVFNSSNIIEEEYEELLLFEQQVQYFIKNGKDKDLAQLWQSFSASIKEDFTEYMYSEHHMMIPLLSSARIAALAGGGPKQDVISIFHSTISQISSRGSLSINLKAIERATYDLCNLVKKNKALPFRTDICIKCEQYIDEHLGEKITASDIANNCGVDRSIIFDIFRKNYNISLTEYIQKEKMRRAKILLTHSTMSILEIATYLGYCSCSYFSKVFVSHFKCTPTLFRRIKHHE